MRTTQFISFTFTFFEFQSIQNALCNIIVSDGLFFSGAIIIDWHKFVPKEVDLPSNNWGKVIIQTKNWAWSENGYIRECFSHDVFSFMFGLEVKRWRIGFCSCCRKMNQSMDSVFCTSFSNTFWHLNIDELKIFSSFYFMSGTKKIYSYIWILHHSLDLRLIFVIHAVVEPSPIFVNVLLRVGPQTLSYLRCSECLKLWSRFRGITIALFARPSSAAIGFPRFPSLK